MTYITAHPSSPGSWELPSLSQQAGNYHQVYELADLTSLAMKFCSSVFLLKGPFLQFSSSISVINDNTIPGSLQYTPPTTEDRKTCSFMILIFTCKNKKTKHDTAYRIIMI
jgi:hypothetical protein